MKKHSMKSSGGTVSAVAARKNSALPYSGNSNSRTYRQKPVSNLTTSGGAYDSNDTKLNGASGSAPRGTQYARKMSARPGEYRQAITPGRALAQSGRAVDVLGNTISGQSYNRQKPSRKASHL